MINRIKQVPDENELIFGGTDLKRLIDGYDNIMIIEVFSVPVKSVRFTGVLRSGIQETRAYLGSDLGVGIGN